MEAALARRSPRREAPDVAFQAGMTY